MRGDLPEFRDWSVAVVRLLQGVVEAEDSRVWNILLTNISQIESYVARIGLRLALNESEGLAYLEQIDPQQAPEGYDAIPKLFRSTRLSYGQTLLCVLLRDALRRFEEEETRDERCVVNEMELLDQWKAFFPQQGDEVKQLRDLHATLRKLEELGFVKPFGTEKHDWEVRRILKARLTVEELEHLSRELAAAIDRKESPGEP